MPSRKEPVPYHLHGREIAGLPANEMRAILRATDPLVNKAGRAMLVKVLRGSREKRLLELELDSCPAFGCYRGMPEEDVYARVDWMIRRGYLEIAYSGRLPLLVYGPSGWEIECETMATELIGDFDRMLAAGAAEYDMSFLKDRNREMILSLLDNVEATGDAKYLPLLRAWERVDYKKVQQRIRQVIAAIGGDGTNEPGRERSRNS